MTTLNTTATVETLTASIADTIATTNSQIAELEKQISETGYRSLLPYQRDYLSQAAATLEIFNEAHAYIIEPRDEDLALNAAYQVAIRTLTRTQVSTEADNIRRAAVELLAQFH